MCILAAKNAKKREEKMQKFLGVLKRSFSKSAKHKMGKNTFVLFRVLSG